VSAIEILFYASGTAFFFSVLAFTYYSLKNAQLMRGPLGHQLMAMGGILSVGAMAVGAVDHFLFPGSGLVYTELAIWIIGLLALIGGGILRARNVLDVHQASLSNVLKVAPHTRVYVIAVATLVLVSLSLSTVSLLSPLRTGPRWYNVVNLAVWTLAFTAMTVVERNLFRAAQPSQATPVRPVRKETLPRDDLLALRIYAELTGRLSATALPVIGIRTLRNILSQCAAEHDILKGCRMTNEGTIAIANAADRVARMPDEDGVSMVLEAFSCLASSFLDLYAAVTSMDLAREVVSESYRQTKARYGDLSVFPQVLRTLPPRFLQEEWLALLSKDELEARVREQTGEMKEALNRARRAADALLASKASFHSIVEMSTDGIIVLDRQGEVRFANPAALSFFQHDLGRVGRLFDLSAAAHQTREVDIIRDDGEGGVAELRVVETEWEGAEAYLALLRDVTERKRIEETLRRRAEELAALQATVLDITIRQDLPTLLETIVERAVQLLDAQAGGMYLCDSEREETRCVVSYNTSDDYTGTVLEYGEGAAGTVAMTGDPLIIDDYRTWSRRAAVYEEKQPFTAVLSTPMTWQGHVIGVIDVLHDVETRRFKDADLELLSLFANHAAIAVENARLYEETHQRAAQLEAVRELGLEITAQLDLDGLLLSIASQAVKLLGGVGGGLYLYRPEQDALEFVTTVGRRAVPMGSILHRGEGLSGKVWETNRPIIVEDYQDWEKRAPQYEGLPIAAAVGVPIRWGGEFLGVLTTEDEARGTFSPTDAELLSLFATQAAIAIRNARLYEETERRATQARLIYEVGQHVSSELEPDTLLSTIVSAVRDAFDYHNVILLLLDEEANRLVMQSIAGAYTDILPSDLSLAVREGMIGYAAATGVTQISNDVSTDPHYVRKTEEDTQSELAVPIKSGQKVIGVLDLQEDNLDAFDQMDVTTMETLSTQIASAIENAHLFQAERKRSTQLATVSKVAESISSTLNPHEVLHRTVELITRTFGYYYASIMLLNPEKGELTLEAAAGGSAGRTPPNFRQKLKEGMIGWAAYTGESILARDVRQESRYLPAYLTDTKSELDVPLKYHDRVIGVLDLQSRELNAFDEHDVMAMEALAGHVAAAIENARLFEETQQRALEQETLREAALTMTTALKRDEVVAHILAQLQEVVPYDTASVQLLRGDLLEIVGGRGFPNLEELLGITFDPKRTDNPNREVVSARAPFIVEDAPAVYQGFRIKPHAQARIRSWLGVPMLVGDRLIGIIALDKQEPGFYAEEHAQLAEAFAAQAAVAIENARLYEEVRRQADELKAAVDQLRELDRLKSEFIQNVSHELRSPLALIRGYSEMLHAGELGSVHPEQEEPIAIIARRARMLSALVHDITLILEAEASPPEPEPIALDELARAAVEDFQISAAEAELTLQMEIETGLPPVRGARTHMRRVLDNLIENAIKFTPQGSITVRVRQPKEGQVLLQVSDTGIGIRPDQQERIFDRFYQVDGSSKRRYPGTGLGLALVKEIVETYGGQISVESAEGKGTTFTVTLPVFGHHTASHPHP
jgi:GAF domain-containing protein/two-component sensor histidine kinase